MNHSKNSEIYEQRLKNLSSNVVDKRWWMKKFIENKNDVAALKDLGLMLSCSKTFLETVKDPVERARNTFKGFLGELIYFQLLQLKGLEFSINVDQLFVGLNGTKELNLCGKCDLKVNGKAVEIKTTDVKFDYCWFWSDVYVPFIKKAKEEGAEQVAIISLGSETWDLYDTNARLDSPFLFKGFFCPEFRRLKSKALMWILDEGSWDEILGKKCCLEIEM